MDEIEQYCLIPNGMNKILLLLLFFIIITDFSPSWELMLHDWSTILRRKKNRTTTEWPEDDINESNVDSGQ